MKIPARMQSLRTLPTARGPSEFLHTARRQQVAPSVTLAMVGLGRKLGLRVLAEGVEAEEQRAFLQACGCDEMQGFLFGKPVAPQEIERMLRMARARKRRSLAA